MSHAENNILEPDALSRAAIEHLKKHRAHLTRLAERGRGFLRFEGEGESETIPLPASFLRVLMRALTEVAEGHPVSVAPTQEEMSTQEAADLLNVSRPYLVKLLSSRKIPHRKVGTHRRIRRADILAYKEKMRIEAEDALQELADQAQELKFGYE